VITNHGNIIAAFVQKNKDDENTKQKAIRQRQKERESTNKNRNNKISQSSKENWNCFFVPLIDLVCSNRIFDYFLPTPTLMMKCTKKTSQAKTCC